MRTHVTVPPTKGAKPAALSPYPAGSSFFFKVKFDEPYLMYRDWREVTKVLLSKGPSAANVPKSKLRRAETKNRVIAPVIGWDAKRQKVKVSPMARWSDEQVERYIEDNGVLVNPLAYDGYPSIGCAPCTRRVAPGEDPRSGRWAGTNKTECGIHA